MTSKLRLTALQFEYENKSLEENFKTLIRLVKTTPKHSIVLAPELCLSGYKYDSLEKSAQFSQKIIPKIQELSVDKTLTLTFVEKIEGKFYNNVKIFSNGELLHSRAKARLFALGNEQKYFKSGNDKDIKIITIGGIKIAVLICFELRFTELWQKCLGADIVLVPSFWGKLRKEHLKTLSHALAIANQCFVLVANSSDETMASSSAVITPFGDVYRDDSSYIINQNVDFNDIKKMRRYLNIGIDS